MGFLSRFKAPKSIISIALILSMLISAGFAAIEVKEGDWAKYQVELEVPEELKELTGYEEFEALEWVKVEVQSVSDTSVSLKMISHYENGTEDTETMSGAGFIIDTDLTEGDEVSAPMFGSDTRVNITGVNQQTFAGASREVYYVDFEQEEMGLSMDLEACWDKETGVLCETAVMMSGDFLGQTIDMSLSVTMTETNLWAAGLFSGQEGLILAVVGIVAVVVVSAILLWRRRKVAPLPDVVPTPTPTE
jgi:hypothetical protein